MMASNFPGRDSVRASPRINASLSCQGDARKFTSQSFRAFSSISMPDIDESHLCATISASSPVPVPRSAIVPGFLPEKKAAAHAPNRQESVHTFMPANRCRTLNCWKLKISEGIFRKMKFYTVPAGTCKIYTIYFMKMRAII